MLWYKNTPASKTVSNSEACLSEVKEAKIASDMKLDTLASETEFEKGD